MLSCLIGTAWEPRCQGIAAAAGTPHTNACLCKEPQSFLDSALMPMYRIHVKACIASVWSRVTQFGGSLQPGKYPAELGNGCIDRLGSPVGNLTDGLPGHHSNKQIDRQTQHADCQRKPPAYPGGPPV